MEDRKGEHPLGDLGQMVCLGVFAVVWAADTFVFHWSTFLAADVPQVVRIGILAVALVLAAILVLGAHRVVTGEERPDHVVDSGPFHYVRHPLYLAAILAYLGTAISSMSLLSLALVVPIFVFYNYIASYEERVLENRFGAAYRDYEAKTGKWVPGLGRVRASGA